MIEQQPTQDDKTIAVLTHLSGVFFGFLVPLIVWLVSRENKPWLADEAKEALNFQITVLIAALISWVLIFAVVGILLLAIVGLANLVLCIIAGVKTSQGERYRYPLTLRLIS